MPTYVNPLILTNENAFRILSRGAWAEAENWVPASSESTDGKRMRMVSRNNQQSFFKIRSFFTFSFSWDKQPSKINKIPLISSIKMVFLYISSYSFIENFEIVESSNWGSLVMTVINISSFDKKVVAVRILR